MENEAQKQPIKEEIVQARAKMREIALKNLKTTNLQNLAIAYFSQPQLQIGDKIQTTGYGEADGSAVEEFLYFPALNSGTKTYDLETGDEHDLIRDSLLGSRQDGKRYSGQLPEYSIIKTSAAIIQHSLGAVKVEDVMELMGSNSPVKEAYKGKYFSELLESQNEKDKEFAQQLIGGCISYKTTQGVSKALGQRAGKIKSGLEQLVKEEEKKEK